MATTPRAKYHRQVRPETRNRVTETISNLLVYNLQRVRQIFFDMVIMVKMIIMVKMVIRVKMVIIFKMVIMVEMVIMAVMAMVIRLIMLIIVTKVTMV